MSQLKSQFHGNQKFRFVASAKEMGVLAGLPDGLFSNRKPQFGENFQALIFEKC
jgi:hypothetical protein